MFNNTLPTPVELAFEPVNLCNAKCFCCPYTFLEKDKEYRGKKMTTEQIGILLDQYAQGLEKFGIDPKKATVSPWRYSDPLVCKDLEMIFEKCHQHGIKIVLTTNAVSFTESKCKMLTKYIETIAQINISIIGYTTEEIKEYMDINWEVTKARLKMIKDKYQDISRKMNIGLKHKNQNPDKEEYAKVISKLQEITLGKVKVKKNWLENRLVYNKFDDDGINFTISPNNFVKGCAMVNGKILRRLEVMVDGTAVLCCDDATKQTNFGNVFDIGIEGVWKNLKEYHNMLYSNQWAEQKKNMMCNTCSRAKFEWSDDRTRDIIDTNNTYLANR